MPNNNASPSITIKKKRKGMSKKIHKLYSRLHSATNKTLQNIIRLLTGTRTTHLIITGFSPNGVNLLFDLLRKDIPYKTKTIEHSTPATATVALYHRNLLTKCPEDILDIEEINACFKEYRNTKYVVVIEDPRYLITETTPDFPSHFFQGYDYQMFVDNAIRSFTSPGIGAKYEAYKKLMNSDNIFATIRAEELLSDSATGKHLLDWAFHQAKNWQPHSDTAKSHVSASNALTAQDYCQNIPEWLDGKDSLSRISSHTALFPELEDMAEELGYPPISSLLSSRFSQEIVASPANHSGTIVLFHTDDEIYRQEARRCINSIESIGLKYDVTVIQPNPSWVENCAIKPKILAEARKRIRGPILYIDVDAVVHKNPWPYLSQYRGDMAVYVHSNGELISSAIYLNDTPEALEILNRWVDRQNHNREVWDQRVLQEIMELDEKGGKRYQIERLPPNFTYIFDKKYPYIHGDIVIEQLQASREIKKENKKALERRKERLKNL